MKAGEKFGPYELLAPIGEGGMGEVWKARDTRLGRNVALKVSKAEFTARFEREARTVASLSHPNICALYDVGPNYLVMELIDGAPLPGPLPVEKAVAHAGQILDALDAAHRRGITHRDLKPANILVTKQGIKLLDFGLAKQAPGVASDAPTVAALSVEGQIAGTLQYMSPEQLQGKDADARSDIFAFGCVLYEMISGKRAFGGASAASVIASILEREPEPLATTAPLDRVIRTCLAKDPDDRFQTARDVKRALLWSMEPPENAAAAQHKPGPLPWVAAAAALALAGGFAWIHFSEKPAEVHAVRFQIKAPPGYRIRPGRMALSPDGQSIAYTMASDNGRGLYVQRLNSLEPRLVAASGINPVWSYDGRSLVAWFGRTLKQVDLSGDNVRDVVRTSNVVQHAIGPDGGVLYRPSGARNLNFLPPGSAVPVLAAEAGEEAENGLESPWFLSSGRRFLFFLPLDRESGMIQLGTIGVKDRTTVVPKASSGAVIAPVPDGRTYLLYARQDTLVAHEFDEAKGAVQGEAKPVAARIGATGGSFRVPTVAASRNGTLAYQSYRVAGDGLVWRDRSGKEIERFEIPPRSSDVALSPDSHKVMLRLDGDLYTMDLATKVVSRFTFDAAVGRAVAWSRDGRRVAFAGTVSGKDGVYEKDASGAGVERLIEAGRFTGVWDWSLDGKKLLVGQNDGLSILTLGVDSSPITLSDAVNGSFSPDGKYIAYQSKDNRVLVISVPPAAGRWQVAPTGASPIWRADGKELYFSNGTVQAVDVTPGPAFAFGAARRLSVGGRSSRPTADGQRFLSNTPAGEDDNVPITVVLNWFAELPR